MTKAKKYWKGLAELNNDPIVEKLSQNEFDEEIPVNEFLGDSRIVFNATKIQFRSQLQSWKVLI